MRISAEKHLTEHLQLLFSLRGKVSSSYTIPHLALWDERCRFVRRFSRYLCTPAEIPSLHSPPATHHSPLPADSALASLATGHCPLPTGHPPPTAGPAVASRAQTFPRWLLPLTHRRIPMNSRILFCIFVHFRLPPPVHGASGSRAPAQRLPKIERGPIMATKPSLIFHRRDDSDG